MRRQGGGADKSRLHYATLSAYTDDYADEEENDNYMEQQPLVYFSPNAPVDDELAPVKPRATPYTEYPLRCSVDYAAGTIRCIGIQAVF